MACNSITVDKSTYESLQQELVELRQIVSQLQSQKEVPVCKSEAWFARLADNVPGVIYQFQLFPDGTVSFPYVSSGCRELYELEPSQVYENPQLLFAVVHPEDLPGLQETIAISTQTLENWEYEWLTITPSGKQKWLKGISKPEPQSDGSILWDGCIIDVSELQAALRDRKQAEIHHKCNTCLVAGVAISFEECLTLRGEENWLLTTLNPLKDSEGRIYRLVGTTFDITEPKKAEKALKASQHFIQRITDSIPNTIYIYDLEEQRNIYANHEIAEILGYSIEEVQEMGAEFLPNTLHPDDWEKVITYHQTFPTAIDGEIFEIEYRMKDAGGKWHWVYSRDTSFSRNADGKVKQLLGVATDITVRKEAEIQLQQQAEYLENTLNQLQRTQAKLIQSEKMSSLGNMVAGVAHEINNPVNFIHANLTPACEYSQDLLQLVELYQQYYPNPPEEIEEKIEDIDLDFIKEDLMKLLQSMRVGTQRIREIVLSLRNFSRLDEAEFKRVNIHEGIESTLMILHNRLKAKPEHPEISVIKEYGKLPAVECYPGQLNQVFMNIFANSIDALEESFVKNKEQKINPQICISTEVVNGNWIVIRIADNGQGIPPEILSKLFDPFFTTKDVGKGTGLGLSISYQIVVHKHGGKLSCHSILGQGAEFVIEIPVTQVKIC